MNLLSENEVSVGVSRYYSVGGEYKGNSHRNCDERNDDAQKHVAFELRSSFREAMNIPWEDIRGTFRCEC